MSSYNEIINLYKKEYKKNGDSVKSLLTPKGRNSLRYSVVLDYLIANQEIKLLDYGCGLGYLYDFLRKRKIEIDYTGVDIVDDFISACQEKFPEKKNSFHIIKPNQKIVGNYDIIFASGVFNLKSTIDKKTSLKKAYDRINELFELTNNLLICDFPTEYVDFVQSNAQHFNLRDLINFCVTKLSRRFVVRHDILPYEYTLILWKNSEIIKPDNVYVP